MAHLPSSGNRLKANLLQVLLPISAVVLVVAGLLAAGSMLRRELRDNPRFNVSFADLQLVPEPPMARPAFLAEVQYLSSLSDDVSLLDESATERLARAFTKHPWVQSVERVEIAQRTIIVKLAYRVPVLAVRNGTQLRAVDSNGVLLPAAASTDGLPIYPDDVAPPVGPTGTHWGDARLEQAARAMRKQ